MKKIFIMTLATKMLTHNHHRFVMTCLGISIAFFLALAQIGLLIGWINTNSAIIKHAGVDIWVMAKQTRAFDYGSAIPRYRVQQASSVSGVEWAEGMVMGWGTWQNPNGKRINVEIIGLDKNHIGAPWSLIAGNIENIEQPQTIIIDELSLDILGVYILGDEAEIEGHRAILGGISKGVRTFTAAPFVFTSIRHALQYSPYYKDDEITYVLVKAKPGLDLNKVLSNILREVPDIEALSTEEFATRSVKYWMLETGVGITVIITAALGLLVGIIIMSQTLFSITQDHIGNYATLLALGFHQKTLRQIILAQSLTLGGFGIGLGSFLFFIACKLTTHSPIPLETTPLVSLGLVFFSLFCCIAGSWFSIRAVFKLDPVSVFH